MRIQIQFRLCVRSVWHFSGVQLHQHLATYYILFAVLLFLFAFLLVFSFFFNCSLGKCIAFHFSSYTHTPKVMWCGISISLMASSLFRYHVCRSSIACMSMHACMCVCITTFWQVKMKSSNIYIIFYEKEQPKYGYKLASKKQKNEEERRVESSG